MPQYAYAVVIIDGERKVIKTKGFSDANPLLANGRVMLAKSELEKDLKATGIKYTYIGISEHPPTAADLDASKREIRRAKKQKDVISKMGKNTPRKSAHDEKLPKNGDIYVCTYGPYSTVEFYMVKGTKGSSMYSLVSISKERYDDENVIPDPRDVLTVGKWHRYNPESKSFQIYPHINAVKWDGKPVYTSDFDYA